MVINFLLTQPAESFDQRLYEGKKKAAIEESNDIQTQVYPGVLLSFYYGDHGRLDL
jgi:hypothetical protein